MRATTLETSCQNLRNQQSNTSEDALRQEFKKWRVARLREELARVTDGDVQNLKSVRKHVLIDRFCAKQKIARLFMNRFDCWTLTALKKEAQTRQMNVNCSASSLVKQLAMSETSTRATTSSTATRKLNNVAAAVPASSHLSSSDLPSSPKLRSDLPSTPRKRGITEISGESSASSAKRRSISFGDVCVRQYERQHAGSGGVPYNGAYPLGLGWKVKSEHRASIDVFERRRSGVRHTSDELPRLGEEERKSILEVHDSRPIIQRAASYVEQRKELEILRGQRDDIGCRCEHTDDNNLCGQSDSCVCFKNGLECCVETCYCDLHNCQNPHVD